MTNATQVDRCMKELARAIASRCRSPTLVIGRGIGLASLIRDRGLEVQEVSPFSEPGSGLPPSGSFRSVVVAHLLDGVGSPFPLAELDRAWKFVAPGGRLVVAVPNRDAARGTAKVTSVRERHLRRTLRTLGRPRFSTDQPFRWLLAYVERPRGSRPPRLRPTWRSRYRATARLCRGRVVELGCGEGHLARLIHDRGLDVVGVDLSARRIETARKLHPGIPFHCADIREADLPEGAFDTAILAEVLEHVDEEVGDQLLARATGLLRPGGRLIVSVPNRGCIPHPNHVRQFDRSSLQRTLKPIGHPHLVVDQPFQWLMMWVQRAEDRATALA